MTEHKEMWMGSEKNEKAKRKEVKELEAVIEEMNETISHLASRVSVLEKMQEIGIKNDAKLKVSIDSIQITQNIILTAWVIMLLILLGLCVL